MSELIFSKYGIEPSITITDTDFYTLSIENKKFLYEYLNQLKEQSENDKLENFHLLLNNKVLNTEKSISLITDFTNIDFNSKQITNLLYKKFADFLTKGEQTSQIINLESIILNLAEDFRVNSGLNIEYDSTITSSNLNKICSLKISENSNKLLIKLCEYINLLCDLKPLKLFILVFSKHYLGNDELICLYKHCRDKEVRLLLIEGVDNTELLDNEKRLIIDKDLCSITQGFEEENY